jgi:hypothetical protein
VGGVIRLGGQALKLLGELKQFRFDFGADHKADERPDLAPLLAIIVRSGFDFRHYNRDASSARQTTGEAKQANWAIL